jgi:GAF domain-containing protein
LPDTRSEAALILRSRGRTLGALSVQSDRPDVFGEQAVAVLQTMADQVAIAIDNARLFTESQAALGAARRAYSELSWQAWNELLHARTDWGYLYANRSTNPVKGDWRPEMRQAERTGQSVQSAQDGAGGPALAIPIRVRGQVMGVLSLRKGEGGAMWTAEEVTLLEGVVAQLDAALESARLYRETQRRAAQEQLTAEMASRIRETLDVDTILQAAAQEIRDALQLYDVTVRLELPEQ